MRNLTEIKLALKEITKDWSDIDAVYTSLVALRVELKTYMLVWQTDEFAMYDNIVCGIAQIEMDADDFDGRVFR